MWWLATLSVSICIVWVIHHLIQYLQETFTIKKNKDMVKIHVEKYEKMLDDICSQQRTGQVCPPVIRIASAIPDQNTFQGFLHNKSLTTNSEKSTCPESGIAKRF
jgi:hypothetical protein